MDDAGPINDQDALKKKAESLFGLAQVSAISSFQVVLDRFDSRALRLAVQQQGTEPWDFFVTAACVFVAINAMDEDVPEDSAQGLTEAVFAPSIGEPASGSRPTIDELYARSKRTWAINGQGAVLDCSAFVEDMLEGATPEESAHLLRIAIGTWVLWNVYGSRPAPEDSDMAAGIGNLAIRTFVSYWQS